jgi:hypothetical protein
MKRFFLGVVAMAAMFVGCQNDPAGIKDALNEPEFSAAFDAEETRVYLGEDNYYRWEAGDKVSVFAFDDRNRVYEAAEGDVILTKLNFVSKPDAPTGSVTPSVWDRHYAVFPYSSKNHLAFVNGAFYSVVAQLEAEQVHDATKAGLDYAIMTSTIPSMDKIFHFKNSCALIKVNVRTTEAWADEFYLNTIKVESKSNYLAGTVVVDAGNDDYTAKIYEAAGNATKQITMSNCESVGKMTPEYKTFIFAIPAGTYPADDLTLSFDCSNDAFDLSLTVPTGYEVARSKYMEFNVTLDHNFSGTFDWYEVAEEEGQQKIMIKTPMVLRKAIIADIQNLNSQNFPYQTAFKYIFDVPTRDVAELVIDGYELENAAGTDLENIEGNRITFKPESRGEGEFPAYVINTFTTLSSGIKGVTPAKVIVKDLIVAGQLRTTTMGIYVNGGNSKPTGAIEGEATDPAAFDTEWNFVKMYGLEIIPYLGKNRDLPYRPEGIGAAVACYGNAVLNYCMVKGTVASEDVATREDLVGIPLYDMASANAATVTLNNSEVGSIYTWEQSTWILNASNVNWINWKALNVSALNKYLTLSNGSHINTLFVNTATPDNQYVPKLNVDETSSIDVLVIKPNFNYANAITRNSFSNVADGTIGKVIVDGTVADGVVSGGTEMTWAEFKANYLTK